MAGRFLTMATRRAVVSMPGIRKDHHGSHLTPALRDQIYPKLGNRDIVGYGMNGSASYVDTVEFPAPAVRFRENSKEILALREKEKGDWKSLSLADKKALYRASFRETFSEFTAPTGEWKSIVSMILIGFSVTSAITMWLKHFVLPGVPHTITREWQEKNIEAMVIQRQGAVSGVSSHWDYENNKWK